MSRRGCLAALGATIFGVGRGADPAVGEGFSPTVSTSCAAVDGGHGGGGLVGAGRTVGGDPVGVTGERARSGRQAPTGLHVFGFRVVVDPDRGVTRSRPLLRSVPRLDGYIRLTKKPYSCELRQLPPAIPASEGPASTHSHSTRSSVNRLLGDGDSPRLPHRSQWPQTAGVRSVQITVERLRPAPSLCYIADNSGPGDSSRRYQAALAIATSPSRDATMASVPYPTRSQPPARSVGGTAILA